MKINNILSASVTGIACLSLAACMSNPQNMEQNETHNHDMSTKQVAMSPNLVEVAQSNKDFSILVEAIKSAELVDTLANTQDLTVFAPTNQAFANLLGELGVTKAQLLADKTLLTEVLTYHVVPSVVYASQVKPGMVSTVQGDKFTFSNDGKITDARGRTASIVATDVKANNGVVHVIDKVILPSAK